MRLAPRVRFGAVAALLLVGYVVLAVVLLSNRDWKNTGTLSVDQTGVPAPAPDLERACFGHDVDLGGTTYKIVKGTVDGNEYLGCYKYGSSGSLDDAKVTDLKGHSASVRIAKAGGAWGSVGLVTRGSDLALGGVALVVLTAVVAGFSLVGPQPGEGGWRTWVPQLLAAMLCCVGSVVVAVLPGIRRARKIRMALAGVLAFGAWIVLGFGTDASSKGDTWGLAVLAAVGVSLVVLLQSGRLWLRPGAAASGGVAVAAGQPDVTQARPASRRRPPPPAFDLTPANRLPSFNDVGGMDELKGELKVTLGRLLAFSEEAQRFRIRWNGILLFGLPGAGKTFVARATAGEFGMNLIHVTTADLVSSYAGETAQNIRRVFAFARQNLPCVLFFDEIDSVARRRDDYPDQDARRTVNELLRTVERYRNRNDLVVMAATNDLESLDPAVIRPGRFDRHIRVDLPDAAGRAAIFQACLAGRPVDDDVNALELAEMTEGFTPAAIAQAVEQASLAAFRASTEPWAQAARRPRIDEGRGERKDDQSGIDGAHPDSVGMTEIRGVLLSRGGKDRPLVEQWSWDRLVLEPKVKAELQQVVALLKDPTLADAFGVDAPSGLLLTGPPGTGKTTIARVLAAEAACSFYPITAADLTSKWVGESENLVKRLFERARTNAPSIVFLDEIDAIAPKREGGDGGAYDRQLTQLLAEIDGMIRTSRVVVIGATNRPELLDPALVRGGRLTRTIDIPLPTVDARRRLIDLSSRSVPLVDVDLDRVAARTEGLSGADIKAVFQQAAVEALAGSTGGPPAVDTDDVDAAITAVRRKADQALAGRGSGRDELARWTWDRLVLPGATKAELKQVVALLKDEDLAAAFGVEPPTGALLAGPPGTGKTTIAKVLANESGCAFFPITAAEITSKYVGESEQLLSRLFTTARAAAPAIIFFDEVDAIASRRDGGSWGDRQLNQLLQEMDGVMGRARVFVLAATNRPEILDPALLRGGRLSRTITIPLPSPTERAALLRNNAAALPLASDVDLDALSGTPTAGMSGADLAAMCQQAAVQALARRQAAGAAAASSDAQVVHADLLAAARALRRRPEDAVVRQANDDERADEGYV